MLNKKRNMTIDIMKGILIILVVIGHSYWYYKKVIFWFHMPLFFMISGYLLNKPEKEKEKEWIIRKCKVFLIPYMAYTFILGWFEIRSGFKAVFVYWFRALYGGEAAGGVYWFITVLLLSEILIVKIENRVYDYRSRIGIYTVMYLLAIVESLLFIPPDTIQVPTYTKLPWDMDVCLISVPYMMIGQVLRCNKDKVLEIIRSKRNMIIIVAGAIAFFALLFLTKSVEWFSLDMKYSQYKNLILDLISPVLFGIVIWFISEMISYVRGGIALHISDREV